MGPFPTSLNNQFILVVVDYISQWVKATTFLTNDAKVVVRFLRNNIFIRFEILRLIISDGRKHFNNQ